MPDLQWQGLNDVPHLLLGTLEAPWFLGAGVVVQTTAQRLVLQSREVVVHRPQPEGLGLAADACNDERRHGCA